MTSKQDVESSSAGSRTATRPLRARRGGVLITTLAFSLVISMLLAGMASISVSHYARARSESDYAAALDLAEGGVNFEFRKISADVTTADQMVSGHGVTYSLGNGTFAVYCTNKDGSTPWVPPSSLYVVSVGTINGVSRTVKVSVKGYGSSNNANYALFGVVSGIANGVVAIGGDVGTDGTLLFNGNPTVAGTVNFNGPGSNWSSSPTGSYTTNYNASPVVWPTVDSIATGLFAGGLPWIATHNDNGLAVPPIVGNSVLLNGNASMTLKGKVGGANYYITSLLCNGNAKVTFDNTAGPINIWQGPSGGSGTLIFNGGTAAIKQSADPTKSVRMYVATTNSVTLNGNVEVDAGVYAYNGAVGGQVTFNGTPNFYGSVISNKFTLNGNPTIHYQAGYFAANSGAAGYYGYDDMWQEQNAR